MLTEDAIKEAIRAGRLFRAKPTVWWAAEPRAFLMCVPLKTAIDEGKAGFGGELGNRWARLEADISHFIEGGYVTEDLVKQLKPARYEHWELRSRKPQPSLRVFGRFAMPDVFVGTHVVPRPLLKGMWSLEFEQEKLQCEEWWKAAGLPEPFSDAPRFHYEAYITENSSRRIKI